MTVMPSAVASVCPPRSLRLRGMTMMETVLVLAVLGAFLTGVVAVAVHLQTRGLVSDVQQGLRTVASVVRRTYGPGGVYTDVSNAGVAPLLPPAWVLGDDIVLGGRVGVVLGWGPAAAQGQQFLFATTDAQYMRRMFRVQVGTVDYPLDHPAACAAVLTAFSLTGTEGLRGVQAHPLVAAGPTLPMAASPAIPTYNADRTNFLGGGSPWRWDDGARTFTGGTSVRRLEDLGAGRVQAICAAADGNGARGMTLFLGLQG